MRQKNEKKKLQMNILWKCLEEGAGYVNYVITLIMKREKNVTDAI